MRPFCRVALIAIACVLPMGCGGEDTHGEAGSEGAGDTVESGQALYTTHCQSCHGENAVGTSICGSLIGDHIVRQSDAALFRMVSSGTGGRMPAFSDTLTTDQIIAVLEHLRTLQTSDADD
ncbi:MAG: c-type cytochrome [Bradymonadia bacterium]